MVWLVVLVFLTGTASPALAQGEHSRRAAAELRVLASDVNKLIKFASNAQQSIVQEGLNERVRGALASLDILLRLADQEAGRESISNIATVLTSYKHLDNARFADLAKVLSNLVDEYPLYLPPYKSPPKARQIALELHQHRCAGCHDHPIEQVKRPAYNLYKQVQSMPQIEFYARMLVGVRGDRITGIDNPLTDLQIAALIAVYEAGEL